MNRGDRHNLLYFIGEFKQTQSDSKSCLLSMRCRSMFCMKISSYKKYWHSLASNFVATIGTFENHKQLLGMFILFGLTLFRRTRRWLAAGAGTAAFPCSWAPWALWPEPGHAWTCLWARISTSGARCKLGEDSTWNPASLGWPPTSWSIPAAIVPDFRRPSARTRCPACRNLEKAWSSAPTSNR